MEHKLCLEVAKKTAKAIALTKVKNQNDMSVNKLAGKVC